MTVAPSTPDRRLSSRASWLFGLLPIFGCTIFLSAALLFTLEPLFTKMALPMLGGAPAVWSVALVFFQTLMLAGYL